MNITNVHRQEKRTLKIRKKTYQQIPKRIEENGNIQNPQVQKTETLTPKKKKPVNKEKTTEIKLERHFVWGSFTCKLVE